jgi:hypothetical protein
MSSDSIRPLTVEQDVHPEGAYQDAANFRHAAERIEKTVQYLQAEMVNLEQALEDVPQKQIVDELAPILQKLEILAATLKIHAVSIESKTIRIKNTIWVGAHQIHKPASRSNPDLKPTQEGYDPPPS